MHKVVFFLILAVSLAVIGRYAERSARRRAACAGRLNLGDGRCLRQARFRQPGVEIFYAVVADRNNHQAGIALRFQVELRIEDREIDAFDRHRIQPHRCDTEQEVADVEVNLLRHPVVIVMQIFAVHIGKEKAAFVVSGFGFRVAKRPSASSWSTTRSSQASSMAVLAQKTTT